jgi:hypothetical protein
MTTYLIGALALAVVLLGTFLREARPTSRRSQDLRIEQARRDNSQAQKVLPVLQELIDGGTSKQNLERILNSMRKAKELPSYVRGDLDIHQVIARLRLGMAAYALDYPSATPAPPDSSHVSEDASVRPAA